MIEMKKENKLLAERNDELAARIDNKEKNGK
jgi:hypothetical protein